MRLRRNNRRPDKTVLDGNQHGPHFGERAAREEPGEDRRQASADVQALALGLHAPGLLLPTYWC